MGALRSRGCRRGSTCSQAGTSASALARRASPWAPGTRRTSPSPTPAAGIDEPPPQLIAGSPTIRGGESMEATEALQALLRWIHIVAGIIWIGLLYFFNFVNAGFAATIDGPTKQKVVPELMPRALYWFRWGAAWTWVTGVLLLLLVFWHGGIMFGPRGGSATLTVLMVLVTFLAPALFYVLAQSGWSQDIPLVGGAGWGLPGF